MVRGTILLLEVRAGGLKRHWHRPVAVGDGVACCRNRHGRRHEQVLLCDELRQVVLFERAVALLLVCHRGPWPAVIVEMDTVLHFDRYVSSRLQLISVPSHARCLLIRDHFGRDDFRSEVFRLVAPTGSERQGVLLERLRRASLHALLVFKLALELEVLPLELYQMQILLVLQDTRTRCLLQLLFRLGGLEQDGWPFRCFLVVLNRLDRLARVVCMAPVAPLRVHVLDWLRLDRLLRLHGERGGSDGGNRLGVTCRRACVGIGSARGLKH